MNSNSQTLNRVWISRLLGFEIGPLPQDWRFWFAEPTDELFGHFWSMIEESGCDDSSASKQPDSRPPMPGAWDQSQPDVDFESDHDFGSDCESDCDDIVDLGHDPDLDLDEGATRTPATSCFSCLGEYKVPGGLPVSLQAGIALQDILPSYNVFAR